MPTEAPVIRAVLGMRPSLGRRRRSAIGPARCKLPRMPQFIPAPTVIEAAGNKPKVIQEFVGRVNSRTQAVSVARMVSPGGWAEPRQTPEFDEYTVVLR